VLDQKYRSNWRCSLRRARLLAVYTDVQTECGDAAAVTLVTLTGHIYALHSKTQQNDTDDNCTGRKLLTRVHLSGPFMRRV